MKKFVAGLVVGIILASVVPVLAESTAIIGRAVQGTFPLIINGMRASKDVIVIDGTSYLPVRASGELFGYDVDFINREVVLVKTGTYTGKWSYYVKSKYFTTDGSTVYTCLVAEDEWYIPVTAFGRNASFSPTSSWVTISLPNKPPTSFNKDAAYSPGIAGFKDGFTNYVRLSALLLKPVVQFETLWLEWK
ncbi:MAG: hypothetical protein Q8P50_05520 [Bacillota bacterium]|nr:hypothetical protein [Bacillota bacterium]